MKEFWNVIQAIFAVVGGWLGYFLGGCDGLLYALLAFVVLDYITGVMCAVADKKRTAEGLGEWFEKQSTQASSNYGIDKDGRVGLYVEEKNRSWCSSGTRGRSRSSALPILRILMRSGM